MSETNQIIIKANKAYIKEAEEKIKEMILLLKEAWGILDKYAPDLELTDKIYEFLGKNDRNL